MSSRPMGGKVESWYRCTGVDDLKHKAILHPSGYACPVCEVFRLMEDSMVESQKGVEEMLVQTVVATVRNVMDETRAEAEARMKKGGLN